MPTNRNNNFDKEFAIGTKIKYNGKLYEVIESNSCADCSIKSFCNASDEYMQTSVVPRDKLINIFGKCSPTDRDDNKSVVFIEVPTTKEPKVYNTVSYKIDDSHKYITIDIPEGFIIDIENSDLDKGIIRFKNKWLTLEQLYKSAKDNNYHTCLIEIKDSTCDKTCEVREKLVALANLMDIVIYFNGDWNYDFTKGDIGYMIVYDTTMTEPRYVVRKFDSVTKSYYGNPIFKNEADAKYVIDNPNFRDILDKIFKM